jgi:hypothetical protein
MLSLPIDDRYPPVTLSPQKQRAKTMEALGDQLMGLVRLGLLRRVGFGRGARYVRLPFWLTWLAEITDWTTRLAAWT